MPSVKEVQLMRKSAELKIQLDEALEKIAGFERRKEAEEFLVKIMNDPRTPLDFKPSTANDFLSKRASIEKLRDMDSAASAVKMASAGSFEIGDADEPDDSARAFGSSQSHADQEFTDWLVERGADQ